jgi:hypothetical protein
VLSTPPDEVTGSEPKWLPNSGSNPLFDLSPDLGPFIPPPVCEVSDLDDWEQFEMGHVRYGQAQGVCTIGTTWTRGQDRETYRVDLGNDMRYRPDVIYHCLWDPTRWVVLEDKWQRSPGSAESKLFENLELLRWSIADDPRVVAAYLVLGGDGFSGTFLARLRRKIAEGVGGVQVFLSEEDFRAHGIPELHTDPTPSRLAFASGLRAAPDAA